MQCHLFIWWHKVVTIKSWKLYEAILPPFQSFGYLRTSFCWIYFFQVLWYFQVANCFPILDIRSTKGTWGKSVNLRRRCSVSLSSWLVLFAPAVSAQHPEPSAAPSGKNREGLVCIFGGWSLSMHCIWRKRNWSLTTLEGYEPIKRHEFHLIQGQ